MALFKRIAMLAAMLFALLSASAYDFEVDGLYYTVESLPDLTCRCSGGKPNENGEIKIPAEVNYRGKNLKVVKITGFRNRTSLKTIEIPNSVTEIGELAFYECTSLNSVTIPNSVKEIGFRAFAMCWNLNSVKLSNSMTIIEEYVFEKCRSLTHITIPNSVTEIRESAFYGCSSLSTVQIPNSVIKIGESAFNDCTSLTSVEIPNSVTEIGKNAFQDCHSLTSVSLSNALTKIDDYTFDSCHLTAIEIPNSVTEIGKEAFSGTHLTKLIIPGNIKTIGKMAFSYCTKLDTICFEKGKEELRYPDPNEKTALFYNTGKNKTVIFKRNVGCGDLRNVVNLIIEDSITNIGYLNGYPKILRNIIIGKGVDLNNLLTRYISDFSDLETLTVKDEIPFFTIQCSNAQYMNVKVRVPAGSLQAYKSAVGWKNFWDIEEYGESSGIESAAITTEKTVSGKYDIYGRPVDDNYVGLVIIQYSDGTTEKVINR